MKETNLFAAGALVSLEIYTISSKLRCCFVNRNTPRTSVLGDYFPGLGVDITFLQSVLKAVLEPFPLTTLISVTFHKFTVEESF